MYGPSDKNRGKAARAQAVPPLPCQARCSCKTDKDPNPEIYSEFVVVIARLKMSMSFGVASYNKDSPLEWLIQRDAFIASMLSLILDMAHSVKRTRTISMHQWGQARLALRTQGATVESPPEAATLQLVKGLSTGANPSFADRY